MSPPSRFLSLSRKPLSRAAIRNAPALNVQGRCLSTEDKKKPLSISDLSDAIAEEHDLTKAQSKRIVSSLFDTITQAVADKKKVSIANFGVFQSAHSKSRQGVNPRTLEKITIPAKERVKFTPYTHFKDVINQRGPITIIKG